jgi:hypothetical protein
MHQRSEIVMEAKQGANIGLADVQNVSHGWLCLFACSDSKWFCWRDEFDVRMREVYLRGRYLYKYMGPTVLQ